MLACWPLSQGFYLILVKSGGLTGHCYFTVENCDLHRASNVDLLFFFFFLQTIITVRPCLCLLLTGAVAWCSIFTWASGFKGVRRDMGGHDTICNGGDPRSNNRLKKSWRGVGLQCGGRGYK